MATTGTDQAPPVDGLRLRVGADLVEVERVAHLVAKYATAEERLFTEGERAYCRGRARRHEHLAARFAAKEAVGKAIGTGVGGRVTWKDVEVVSDAEGPPRIRLHGEAEQVGGAPRAGPARGLAVAHRRAGDGVRGGTR